MNITLIGYQNGITVKDFNRVESDKRTIVLVHCSAGRVWALRSLAKENLPQMKDFTAVFSEGDFSQIADWCYGIEPVVETTEETNQ